MNRIHVKPMPGHKVPDYEMGDFIPESGRLVLRSVHVIRRLNDGSLTICDPPADGLKAGRIAPAASEPLADMPAATEAPRRGRAR